MGKLATSAKDNKLQANTGAPAVTNLIERFWPRIVAVMPKHLTPERMFQLAITTINTTPKLAECTPESLLSCLMRCSALGLEPSAIDGLGRAYILPYFNGKTKRQEATFIMGYKGMIELARRSKQIKSINARAVYEGDYFKYEFGLNEELTHVPELIQDKDAKLTHVYMIAHFVDGGHHIEVMSKEQVDDIRKRSKASNSGPWVSDYEAMAKKTVIRRAFPFLPVSVEAQTAVAADETSGNYSFVKDAFTLDEQMARSADATIEAEIIDETDLETETSKSLYAVCKNCGNTIFDIAPDATASDIQFLCCETPAYEIKDAD